MTASLQSNFYTVDDVLNEGKTLRNVFGTRSNSYHAKFVKLIQRCCFVLSLLAFEPLIDKTICTFLRRLQEAVVL